VAFSSDGKTLAAGCQKNAVKLWDLSPAAGPEIAIVPGGEVRGMAFVPDSVPPALALGCLEGHITLWEGGKERRQYLSPLPNAVWSVAVSPDGRVLAAGDASAVGLWDLDHVPLPERFLPGRAATRRLGEHQRQAAVVGPTPRVRLRRRQPAPLP
jgi:WD40 repeat protein